MIWLILASLIWGFSFGLIKGMTGGMDPLILALARSLVACAVFLPFGLRELTNPRSPRGQLRATWLIAFIAGVVQLGLMYPPYLSSFKYLKAHEVALHTMTTPLILFLLMIKANLSSWPRLLGASLLAVSGGLICAWQGPDDSTSLKGIMLVQLANLLFASGSLIWRKLPLQDHRQDGRRAHPSWMFPYFVGASAASGACAWLLQGMWQPFSHDQVLVILWLGAVASGAGFFLWNYGLGKVSPGRLAVANNLKLPIAILISLTIFGESANLVTLTVGVSLISLALYLADARPKAK